jgi:transposase InsO family protein
MSEELLRERKLAIIQLQQGKSMTEVSNNLGRSIGWVSKWYRRFNEEGWRGLQDRSRAPKNRPHRLRPSVRQAVCQVRLELEAEAALGTGLKYIGGRAVRTRLNEKEIRPLPSVSTIERVLREAGLTRNKKEAGRSEVDYPHLQPTAAHQLCQVDIFPRYLQGGQHIACFNALDVVSRYPTGLALKRQRSKDAATFLLHVWRELGIPQYTQVDNEGCFSGGFTHPYVLGKVVRLALAVGTELVFSPVYHPQSNGYVERFHQDYDRHVWQGTYLADLEDVQHEADRFFDNYRQRSDHSALNEQTPQARHHQSPPKPLPKAVALSVERRPLYEGRVHFIRRVSESGTIRVLNVDWQVPQFDPLKGVWATLELGVEGATLSIFDSAPSDDTRECLVVHPFPLKEAVRTHPPQLRKVAQEESRLGSDTKPVIHRPHKPGRRPLISTVTMKAKHITQRLFFTMF